MEKINYQARFEHQEPTKAYKILETFEFFTDQLREIKRAQNRVWIQTMAFESSEFTDSLVESLIDAHERGLDVKFVYDSYSQYVTDNTFNKVPLLKRADRVNKKSHLKRNAELLSRLSDQVNVRQTNIPSGFISHTPFPGIAGRDHKKISVIDNAAYIGGINLTPLDEKRIDFMLKTDNQSVVNVLADVFKQSYSDLPTTDKITICDPNNAILVDSGKRSRSIIMEHVYEAIADEDESITLITPFLPSGQLRSRLNAAATKGVQVEVITSRLEELGFTPKMSQLVHNVSRVRPNFTITRYPGVVHAKALILGSNYAFVGSHNFDELFVRLATEEVCLLTQQPEIIGELNSLSNNLRNASIN